MSEKTSSYCLPIYNEVGNYTESIENLSEKKLKIILKLILVSGFRVGEILNSYLFYDGEGNVIIRTLNSKSKEVKLIKGDKHYSEFLGRERLDYYRKSNQKVFKSVKVINIFKLDVGELEFLINDDYDDIKMYVGEYLAFDSYITAYRMLKNKNTKMEIKIKFKKSSSETDFVRNYTPSFHFYRKLFASHYNKVNKNNFIKTIDFMRWKNINMIIDYVKDY